MIVKDVLPENDLLEQATTLKRLECFPLRQELKAKIDIAKKQDQQLSDIDEFQETINKKSKLKNYRKLLNYCSSKRIYLLNI